MDHKSQATTEDPGRTPGQAEGTLDPADQSRREPAQPANAPDQAEGKLDAEVESPEEPKRGQ